MWRVYLKHIVNWCVYRTIKFSRKVVTQTIIHKLIPKVGSVKLFTRLKISQEILLLKKGTGIVYGTTN